MSAQEKQEELVNMAALKLRAIAEEMAGGEEGLALWRELERVRGYDQALADALLTRFTDFLTKHAKLVAVAFFREGEQRGKTLVRQQQEQRRRPRPTQPRLQ